MLNIIAYRICDDSYLMPFVVIPLGAMLVLLVRKYEKLKSIIV